MAKPVSKKKPQARRQPVVQRPPVAPPQHPVRQWLLRALGFKSMLLAAVVALLLYGGVRQNDGYKWVWNSYLKGNWEFMRKHPKATAEQILAGKLGFDYSYVNFVKKNTPDTAIILFPLQEHIMEKGGDAQLSFNIRSKMWVTHFVYPRRILYKDEKDTNPLYKDVTHVAIIAAHGYEDLSYFVRERSYFTVMPKRVEE